ncbi:oligopeptide ABC transporter permease [Priestia taiwanensis]|uniref:Peptide ABC transporter permease n=1 Tax=Priestia taiwanensis TaxID=1347902 RepID=A0A917AJL5_9BACI|nr:oligopeptide ABC transporter permease [Priestia taiwanensis]MBM7361772.1 peptide/nickel transport system permease protein [Priestia taiwanensis]GGE56882.1 peptide ABC transporter permease [Priestia taiwanensis]
MWKFILRRILIMIPQLVLLSALAFALAKAMPGDVLSEQIDMNPDITAEHAAELREKMGLNDSWYVQYANWAKGLAQGDFGYSFKYKMPIEDLFAERVDKTLLLSICILITTYILAIPLGIVSGRWHEKWPDRIITGYSYLAFATPTFIFALIVLFVFGFILNWFPTGGSVDIYAEAGTLEYYISKAKHLVLPTLSGALIATTATIQYLRSEIVDSKIKDFVRTARAKGVPESKIYSRHILRNSFIPIAAFLGYEITGLIGGQIILERIYSYPGLGDLFINSIMSRDYPVMVAFIMVGGLASLFGTLLSDIILSTVDPRIRIQ